MDEFKRKMYSAAVSGDEGDDDDNDDGDGAGIQMKDRVVSANVHLWNSTDRVVLSDVDGTITKSDVGGHILTKIGFEFVQKDIVEILTRINGNGYRLIYLTARGIGQCAMTRDYLFRDLNVPNGAVLCSPSTTRAALYREVIQKRAEEFKIPTLNAVIRIFGGSNPLIAGFGNRDSDALSYHAVGIAPERTFIIGLDEKEKAEAKKGGMTAQFVDDYTEILKNANDLFPRLTK